MDPPNTGENGVSQPLKRAGRSAYRFFFIGEPSSIRVRGVGFCRPSN